MPMPRDIEVIDLMMAIPNNDTSDYYDFIKPLLMDEEVVSSFRCPPNTCSRTCPRWESMTIMRCTRSAKWMSSASPRA